MDKLSPKFFNSPFKVDNRAEILYNLMDNMRKEKANERLSEKNKKFFNNCTY